MARQIYKVHATQVVTSDSHPEGLLSDITGYPMPFDSRSYGATEANPNGNEEVALLAAQAEYAAEIVRLVTANNANRAAWAVYIIRASDGKEIACKSWGDFPMIPVPEPTPEQEEAEGV